MEVFFMMIFASTVISTNYSHYNDVIMGAMASQITSLMIVYSAVYSRSRSKKTSNSASLAFVRGIHRSPVNSPHKGPVTRNMFPFDYVIMTIEDCYATARHRRMSDYIPYVIVGCNYLFMHQIPLCCSTITNYSDCAPMQCKYKRAANVNISGNGAGALYNQFLCGYIMVIYP